MKRTRKRFNKVVKALADLHDRRYEDVLKIYSKMDGSISDTKAILNMSINIKTQ